MSTGRIRSLRPEILDDELAAGLTDAAWRLWIGLRPLADDYGNARAGDRYLAANIWQDTARDVAPALRELVEKGFVEPYAVQGQRFVHINGWEREQRIDNAGRPRVPSPSENDGSWFKGTSTYAPPSASSRREPPRVAAAPSAADSGTSTAPNEVSRTYEPFRGEVPRASAAVGESPLARRAHAQSGGVEGEEERDLEGEPERERARTRAKSNDGAEVETSAASTASELELDDELRTDAATVGVAANGLEDVFALFRAAQNADAVLPRGEWLRRWRMWLVRERSFARKDRERGGAARRRGPPLQADSVSTGPKKPDIRELTTDEPTDEMGQYMREHKLAGSV